jgi:FlaA1/EpsC-like NDP-sugar epimerase
MVNLIVSHFSNRFLSKWIILFFDLAIIVSCYLMVVILLSNTSALDTLLNLNILHLMALVGSYLVSFARYRPFDGIIRLTNMHDAVRIIKTTLFSMAIQLGLFAVASLLSDKLQQLFSIEQVSFGVILVLFLLVTFVMISSRFLIRGIFQKVKSKDLIKTKVLIYGAGSAGIVSKNTILEEDSMKYEVFGFIDENPGKQYKSIHGVKVYTPDILNHEFIAKNKISQIIIAINNITASKKSAIIDTCLSLPLVVKTIPPVSNWINGELTARQIKNVKIEELLNRQEIKLDNVNIAREIENKVILLTGGAGSIGSELARQIIRYNPEHLIIVDQAETPMNDLQLEIECALTNISAPCSVSFIIADITNRRRMESIFEDYKPHILFHAAAYKHVPMMECNVHEAIHSNIYGSGILAELSIEHGVEKFVLVSTDKAVNPTSVMGATKRAAEKYIQSLAKANPDKTSFITTRFGNVLGSNGSVIPLFRKQIEAGGPITVTHPEITRYFMTIPEACNLVLEAAAMGQGQEIFVFDMGESVKIAELAKKMIKLSNLRLGKDIEIAYTGLRPGEKLYEELLANNENTLPTHHPKIMIAKVNGTNHKTLKSLQNLTQDVYDRSSSDLILDLKSIVPEFVSNNSVFEALDQPKVETDIANSNVSQPA